jgi:hypothetical protein
MRKKSKESERIAVIADATSLSPISLIEPGGGSTSSQIH